MQSHRVYSTRQLSMMPRETTHAEQELVSVQLYRSERVKDVIKAVVGKATLIQQEVKLTSQLFFFPLSILKQFPYFLSTFNCSSPVIN